MTSKPDKDFRYLKEITLRKKKVRKIVQMNLDIKMMIELKQVSKIIFCSHSHKLPQKIHPLSLFHLVLVPQKTSLFIERARKGGEGEHPHNRDFTRPVFLNRPLSIGDFYNVSSRRFDTAFIRFNSFFFCLLREGERI